MDNEDLVMTADRAARACLLGDQSKKPPHGDRLHTSITHVEVDLDDDADRLRVTCTAGDKKVHALVTPSLVIAPGNRPVAPADIEPAVWDALERASAQLAG